MKDGKMLFLIHQRVNGEIFEKITCCENVKEAWSTLEKVRLQALRRKYELPMTNKELMSQLDRLINLANQMRRNGDIISNFMKIEKVLRTLTSKYEHIAVALEESKNLDEMKV